jgi:hypothetical protein
MSLKIHAAVARRLQALADPAVRDRGEGPIPHVVMIAMMVAVAIAIGGMILTVGEGWIGQIPKTR